MKRDCRSAPVDERLRATLGFLERLTLRPHELGPADADVEALVSGGHSEDEIFEQTVSAAVAAGLERLEAGLSVL